MYECALLACSIDHVLGMGAVLHRPVVSIEVVDRHHELIIQERVPLYLRCLYQLMYENPCGRALTTWPPVQRALRHVTAKHGVRMDSARSADAIPYFIRSYGVEVSEVELPLDQYANFNEFFARKLKPGCRPIAKPNDSSIMVSPADCRILIYHSLQDTEHIWLKGKRLSLQQLLGAQYNRMTIKKPAVVIARLAPNDYHRWHLPLPARLGEMEPIHGTYCSVSPRAVRNSDILARNKRVVCSFFTEENNLGQWFMIPVGAAMVSSINFNPCLKEGMLAKKGDEHGWFMFGGSTLVLLFEQNRIVFDSDIVRNSRQAIETYVRMGEQIGRVVCSEADAVAAFEQQSTLPDKNFSTLPLAQVESSLLDVVEAVDDDFNLNQIYSPTSHLRSSSLKEPLV